jgi:hypothetical protein
MTLMWGSSLGMPVVPPAAWSCPWIVADGAGLAALQLIGFTAPKRAACLTALLRARRLSKSMPKSRIPNKRIKNGTAMMENSTTACPRDRCFATRDCSCAKAKAPISSTCRAAFARSRLRFDRVTSLGQAVTMLK